MNNSKTKTGSIAKGKATENGRGKSTSAKKTAQPSSMQSSQLMKLFETELKDIYWAEKVLTKTLPKMVKNASSPELVTSLKNQLNETQEHVSRLEKIFEVTGVQATAKKCEAMDGILKETNNLIKQTDLGVVRDAGMIAAGQKVKHYEIATYGTLHAYAKTLGENKAANLLALSLDEEKKTDALLTGIAMSHINKQAHKADAITNT